MKKGESLKQNTRRKKDAVDFWLRVATDSNSGLNPEEIAERYTNPMTGEPYSVKHIYWVLRQLNLRKTNV